MGSICRAGGLAPQVPDPDRVETKVHDQSQAPARDSLSHGVAQVGGSQTLQQPPLREAHHRPGPHDEVIEHPHLDHPQGRGERLGEQLVGARRLGDARRVLGCILECQRSCISELTVEHLDRVSNSASFRGE